MSRRKNRNLSINGKLMAKLNGNYTFYFNINYHVIGTLIIH